MYATQRVTYSGCLCVCESVCVLSVFVCIAILGVCMGQQSYRHYPSTFYAGLYNQQKKKTKQKIKGGKNNKRKQNPKKKKRVKRKVVDM